MTYLDAILQKRRSIRKYTEEIISMDKIEEIINAGIWAPTACNLQAYRFIYIEDRSLFEKITKAGSAHFLANCKQAILVLYKKRTDNTEYSDNILSAGAVIQSMLLKASELDIGACWVCNLPMKKVMRKIFNISNRYNPVSLITLGFPANERKEVKRKYTVSEVLYINKYTGGGGY
ncbi:MAG: nitroreductase family protein [Treponema sp.]|jgi:nitroreductase|nr:nitroreductase family protein [Treponema sp.]